MVEVTERRRRRRRRRRGRSVFVQWCGKPSVVVGLLASRSNGDVGGSSKELVAQNNGKSSVYLMARNHAILSSTVGLLPRCRPSVGLVLHLYLP